VGPGKQEACLPGPETLQFLQRLAQTEATTAPAPEQLHFPGSQGVTVDADLYRAKGEVRGTLLIVSGASRTGKGDPRLVRLAASLAASGITVLVPEYPTLAALKVTPAIIPDIQQTVAFLTSRQDLAPHGRIGILAISFSVGPAVIAALQPDVGSRLDVLVGLGGYYDVEQLLTFLTTGWYHDEAGHWRYHSPNRYGQWVFLLSNVAGLTDAHDRQRLTTMAERRLADPKADITDLAAGLGPEGQAIYALLTNDDPQRVPRLIAALPGSVRESLEALDLSRQDLRRLQVPLLLLHGRQDDIFPYVGSIHLHRAAPAGLSRLFVIDGLEHVDIRDIQALVCAADALLRALRHPPP
jgi:pimeloyl-ACP methyl ester carboxylesterase